MERKQKVIKIFQERLKFYSGGYRIIGRLISGIIRKYLNGKEIKSKADKKVIEIFDEEVASYSAALEIDEKEVKKILKEYLDKE